MTKIKSTKRSLIGSIMALVFCCSIFLGTTFAWFTSSASAGVNTIKSGNLKVDLVDANNNSLEGKTVNFVKSENAPANEAILWEPGCTYNLKPVYVMNKGNLALKYKLVINGINGDAELLEAINFTVKVGDDEINLDTYEGNLTSWQKSADALVISGHMKEEAGNEYQGKTLSGISIQVVATQDTVESDSKNNRYDAGANVPVFVTTTEELKTALTKAVSRDTIVLAAGEFSLPSNIKEGVTIIGSDNTVIVPADTNTNNNVVNATNLTVKNVTFAAKEGLGTSKGIALQFTGSGTFTDCTFTGSNGVRMSYAKGDVVFKGCTFGTDKNIYGVHFDGGKGTVTLLDCEINGWTSFGSEISKVNIAKCNFDNNTNNSYKVLRFYQNATVSDCTFPGDMKEIGGAKDEITITINNCKGASDYIQDLTGSKTVKFVVDGKIIKK